MAESMHSKQKLRSGSLWVSASQCAPCSSGWVTQESQNVLGWNNTQRPRPWKWQVLDIQMLFSGQYNSQFCHLLAEYTWLIAVANLQLLLSQCICEKSTEIMTLLATLPAELQPIPSLNQFLFFKSRKWNKVPSLWREKKKNHWP